MTTRDTDQGGPFDGPPRVKLCGNADDSEFGLYSLEYGEVFTWITWMRDGKVEYRIKFYSREAAEELWKEIEYDFFAREVSIDSDS